MTIAELYDLLYKDSLLPRNGFCESVDANFYLFDFSKTITDAEEYDQTLRILSDYGIILSQNKEARLSQRVVLRALALFENHPTINHSGLFEIKHYESLIFAKAANLYYLKKYRQSRKILKNLIAHFPENKMYKRWAPFARNKAISQANLVALIALGSFYFLLNLAFKSYNASLKPLLWTTTAIFLVVLVIEVLLYLSNRNLKKNIPPDWDNRF